MRSYLIVDDNRAMAENLAEILRDRGDEAVVAGCGAEAIALARRQHFDAVLTDMRMPTMDGATLIRELRTTDPGLPAIVITAFSRDVRLRAAQNEGTVAVLPKPVPVPQLLHLLSVARRHGRVVVVEDDPILLDNLSEILQERGFSVIRVEAADEIDGLPPEHPLLAVVDLRVPGAPDGGAALRLAERFPGLRLLVATAHRDIPLPLAAERAFLKPFDTGDLVAAIETAHAIALRSER
jgi:CheY-like chemotaxis protein